MKTIEQAIFFGTVGGTLNDLLGFASTANTIPKVVKVESGYVQPKALEVKIKDKNNNGQWEVLMEYNGRTYQLREDSQGNPVVIVDQTVENY